MLSGARKSIELRDDQGVVLSDEIERGFELRTLPDRRHLFAENLLASSGGEIAVLGIETCLLFQCAGACVANLQFSSPYQLNPRHYDTTVSKVQFVFVRGVLKEEGDMLARACPCETECRERETTRWRQTDILTAERRSGAPSARYAKPQANDVTATLAVSVPKSLSVFQSNT